MTNMAQTDIESPSGAPVVELRVSLHLPLICKSRLMLLNERIQKLTAVTARNGAPHALEDFGLSDEE